MIKIGDYKDLAKKIIYFSKKLKKNKISKDFFQSYENKIICNKYKNYISQFLI